MPLAARGSPLDGRPKQHQGLCPCKPALAAEGSGARGGEATPHTRAEAWGHCAPSSRIRLRRSYGRGTHPQGCGAPAIQLDRASFKSPDPGRGRVTGRPIRGQQASRAVGPSCYRIGTKTVLKSRVRIRLKKTIIPIVG